ncbi:hypothetical protein MBLNU230_g3373t1 [Neophaeotheca triangularis]
MASNMPIPEPPRTPTPPLDNSPHDSSEGEQYGLGLSGSHIPSPIKVNSDSDERNGHGTDGIPQTGTTDTSASFLSPTSASFSSVGGLSPQSSLYSPITPQTGSLDGAFQTAQGQRNPFNFTTQQYTAGGQGNMAAQSRAGDALGKRRGHKYRHSSIHTSHQIFQTPTLRTPLAVPQALPMPTRKEAWWSMTTDQTLRLAWCCCHFLVAGYVQFAGAGSLSMTALSRLLLFDAAGAVVCVVVDVMGNFEVWQRSSIKHPFGLERADVLAGFGMAVFIGFMGLDILSHGIQHLLENVGDHEAHSAHGHTRVSAGQVDSAALLAMVSTLFSVLLLKNHARIGRAMRVSLPGRVGDILGNPSHLLTLSCSVLLLALPFLSLHTYNWFDAVLSFTIAGLMVAFGVRLATSLASMLLMSYKPSDYDPNAVRDCIYDIETDPGVSSVDEARFWQVHYGLCMANLKLKYRDLGYGEDMTRIRQRIMSLVRERLGGTQGVRWDVSVQMTLDVD